MRQRNGTIWIVLGLLLLVAAAALTGYNLQEANRAKASADALLEALKPALPEPPGDADPAADGPDKQPDFVRFPDMEMPVKIVNGMELVGVLSIPTLDLTLPVLSTWSYPDLQAAPCRYSGSAYQHNLVLAGHNYPAHFGLLSRLREGDAVRFTDMDGNVFSYQVTGQERLSPTAVEAMTAGEDWDLTLFTCTLDGQTRVTVRCTLTGAAAAGAPQA